MVRCLLVNLSIAQHGLFQSISKYEDIYMYKRSVCVDGADIPSSMFRQLVWKSIEEPWHPR
jgi:hypothetical protein